MACEAGCLGYFDGEVAEDDLSREVYCVLGMPVDVIDLPGVLRRIGFAAATTSVLFLSTPNLNFLVQCQSDREFRDSLLLSDLLPADGMPIVWLGRLLGVPIKDRVAGSDILAAIKATRSPAGPLKLFLFGGDEGVAAAASCALNAARGGVQCVGWYDPGFCSVEEISEDFVIDMINSHRADFLVVSLGSKKGQSWLKRNSAKLQVPIRAHLGASLNFEAGTVKRAPTIMQTIGLEWLWRIKEEPYLWKRYWHDGKVLLRLLYQHVLPLVIYRVKSRQLSEVPLKVDVEMRDGYVKLYICGAAISKNISQIVTTLRTTLAIHKCVVFDFSGTCTIDARFLGLLLVARKNARCNNKELVLTGLSSEMKRIVRLNGADCLLE
jgi:N-acetylglucosaminyldiphosphoundecaprenol N-acetyl-beta-D-mannosaminyltransferase